MMTTAALLALFFLEIHQYEKMNDIILKNVFWKQVRLLHEAKLLG